MYLILSFDTEDYETPEADDAEMLWAEMLAGHGLKGCFCVVGEEARALRDRGRLDVIAALSRHEIAYHSNLHSAHPTHAEYLDTLDWQSGLRRVLDEESRGVSDVAAVFGQWPSAYCKPGSSWGPQVPHALARLGVPVFTDAPFELAPGVPLRYVGSSLVGYHTSFDRYFDVPSGERLSRMQRDFESLLATRAQDSVVVIYTHPCRTFTAQFTDSFTAGRNPPRSEWGPSPLRPRDEIAGLVRDFDAFVGWLAAKAESGQLVPTTYRDLSRRIGRAAMPWLALDEVPEMAVRLADAARPDYARVGQYWLSPAEQFGVVTWALARWDERRGPTAGVVPVRELLGPVEVPAELTQQLCVAPSAILAAARALPPDLEAVPAGIPVDGRAVGPAAFLRAAARLLSRASEGGEMPADPVAVYPTSEIPSFADRPDVADLHFRRTWSVFPPDFDGARVLRFIRLQTWTARPVS